MGGLPGEVEAAIQFPRLDGVDEPNLVGEDAPVTSALDAQSPAALAVSSGMGLALGLAIGVLPYLRATIAPFVAALSLIPPLAVLPILFIVAGLGETAKITLIIIGVAPFIVRDLAMRAAELPTCRI